ncbi:MAG TPA: hypothetical protein VGL94_18640 [Ktedonobacteraceae bacterium]
MPDYQDRQHISGKMTVDHDERTEDSIKNTPTVTQVGVFLPDLDELFLYGVTSKVTSDCLVDRLIQWWETIKDCFPDVKTLVINLDNGPENHSHRTQFMKRMVDFAQEYHTCMCV